MHGEDLHALVVGGGKVGSRKLTALLDAGARVHLVAPAISPEAALLVSGGRVDWTRGEYDRAYIADATLVFAATDSDDLNNRIARDARAAGRLVNVAGEGSTGDFSTPAVHRDGQLVVAVFAGGLPAAAARVRDAVARGLHPQLSKALASLSVMRRELLSRNERETWNRASDEMLGDDFPESVANGRLEERLNRWPS
jgi:precorrin-2 dehydrogenase/sirohydrochlorin ferrochelatase